MEINFCRRCGRHLTPVPGIGGAYQCSSGHTDYYKPYPAVLALLLNKKNDILMAVRAHDPGAGTLDLPGGFLDLDETLKQAASRELQEETGLLPGDYTELEYLCEAIDEYEYQGEVLPGIVVTFWARMVGDEQVEASDDVAELKWMPLDAINPNEVHPGFRGVRAALAAIGQRVEEK